MRIKTIGVSGLKPARGAVHKAKRVGRGGDKGKTSGRGHKGQKARKGDGKPTPGFEGGQTPITLRFPKRGFSNYNHRDYAPVNLDRLQHWINTGRLISSPDQPITAKELAESNCVHGVQDGIKLLGNGVNVLQSPIFIQPSRASKSAIRAIEQKGGAVICKYYNDLALRDCVKGRTDRKSAAPTRREDIAWYSDFNNRGYLDPKSQDKWKQAAEKWQKARDAGRLVTSSPPLLDPAPTSEPSTPL